MTTIIQNSRTGQYLDAEGEWVAEPAKALAFDTSLAALGYLFEKQLRNAILVMRFKDPQYDIRLHPFEESAPQEGLDGSSRGEKAARKPRRRTGKAAPAADAPNGKTFEGTQR